MVIISIYEGTFHAGEIIFNEASQNFQKLDRIYGQILGG